MNKKIAIILIGHMRSWNICKEYFMQYFNKYNPDVYALTYNTINFNSNDNVLTNEEIVESLKDINVVKLRIKDENVVFEEAKNKYSKFQIDQNRDANAISWTCQLLNLETCFNDIIESGIKYDYVIKTRYDVQYLFDERNLFVEKENCVNISTGHSCCDIVACGKFERMYSYCTIANNLEFLYNKVFKEDCVEMNPHILLYYNFAYNNSWFNPNLDIKLIRI